MVGFVGEWLGIGKMEKGKWTWPTERAPCVSFLVLDLLQCETKVSEEIMLVPHAEVC